MRRSRRAAHQSNKFLITSCANIPLHQCIQRRGRLVDCHQWPTTHCSICQWSAEMPSGMVPLRELEFRSVQVCSGLSGHSLHPRGRGGGEVTHRLGFTITKGSMKVEMASGTAPTESLPASSTALHTCPSRTSARCERICRPGWSHSRSWSTGPATCTQGGTCTYKGSTDGPPYTLHTPLMRQRDAT